MRIEGFACHPGDSACHLGVTSGSTGSQGVWKTHKTCVAVHPSPWGHLQTLGTLRDVSSPWGTPLLQKTPNGMFQLISGGPRTWGHPGLRTTQAALGMLHMVSPSPGDPDVPAGHHPGIPSVGPVPGGISAAARARPRRVGAAAAPCQRHHLPHREPQRPGGTLR